MTKRLKESIEVTQLNLRVALKDMVLSPCLDKLTARFDTVLSIAPYSAHETLHAGRAACWGIWDQIHKADDAGWEILAEQLRGIISEFLAVLTGRYGYADDAEKTSRKDWDLGDVEKVRIGRWESRGGKYYAELWRGRYDYSYQGTWGGGSICNPNFPTEAAVLVMQARLARGCFLPDNAKTPMKRVK